MSGIGLHEIHRFLEHHGGRLRCPLCGCDTFDFASQADQPIALLYENSGRSWFGPPGYLRVFALSCSSCSYVVTLKLEAIEAWMAEQAAVTEGPQPPPAGGG